MEKTVKIAKEFRWEMAHRLPFHRGGCQNIHGHSYRAVVEIEGMTDAQGMVMDYSELKRIVKPLIMEFDHAFMCSPDDLIMKNFLSTTNFKVVHVNFLTTAENLSKHLAHRISLELRSYSNLQSLKISVFETQSTYAQTEMSLE